MKNIIISAALLIVFSMSFAYASRPPDWISGKSKQYLDNEFLLGIGIGKTLDAARSNARAEISKIFKVAVSQISNEVQKEETSIKNGASKTTNSQKADIATTSSTNEMLEGVSVPETYFDTKTKDYYALAILDKKKLSAVLSGQIADLEALIQAKLSAAKQDVSRIDRLRAVSMAITAGKKMNELSGKKRIVQNVSMSGMENESLAQFEKIKEQEIKNIVFVVLDESKDENKIKDIVNNSITELGFKVSSSSDPVDNKNIIILRSKLELKPLDRNLNNWKFCGWEASFDLFDSSLNGKLLSSVSPNGSASGANETSARDKALFTAKQEISSAVKTMISKYLFNE
jgi:hypothetical protein